MRLSEVIWKCRKGIREIDILLSRYTQEVYPKISEIEQKNYVEFILSHFSVSFPHKEQEPLADRPPQDPVSGFLLKITPIDIPAIARIKIIIPKNNSTVKINVILAFILYIISNDRVFTLISKSVILKPYFRRVV